MKILSKQLVVMITVLLLAAQFSSLAHAVDHPFHASQDSCSSFIHFEQHDLADSVAIVRDRIESAGVECVDCVIASVDTPFPDSYSARAPPYLL